MPINVYRLSGLVRFSLICIAHLTIHIITKKFYKNLDIDFDLYYASLKRQWLGKTSHDEMTKQP